MMPTLSLLVGLSKRQPAVPPVTAKLSSSRFVWEDNRWRVARTHPCAKTCWHNLVPNEAIDQLSLAAASHNSSWRKLRGLSNAHILESIRNIFARAGVNMYLYLQMQIWCICIHIRSIFHTFPNAHSLYIKIRCLTLPKSTCACALYWHDQFFWSSLS